MTKRKSLPRPPAPQTMHYKDLPRPLQRKALAAGVFEGYSEKDTTQMYFEITGDDITRVNIPGAEHSQDLFTLNKKT